MPLVVIEARAQSNANADYALSVQDVKNCERANGRIKAGSVVAMLTGWEDKWTNPTAFFGQDGNGLHFPGFASETTHFLLTQRRVGALALTPTAWTRAKTRPMQRTLKSSNSSGLRLRT